ncbi:MAG: serine hydrolase [Bacteroidota bacterium]
MRLLIAFIFIASLSSCHVGRFAVYNFANITDHKIFPYTEILPSDQQFQFQNGTKTSYTERIEKITITPPNGEGKQLDDYLREETKTTAFLVIKNDSILFEQYYRGYEQSTISNIFSATKSVTSMMVGIAIDEGKIKDVNDVVTDYLPDFKNAHPYFQQLTIQHLLDMRAGFDFQERYATPFAEVAKLYYETNQQKQLLKLGFSHEPGTYHSYQSASTSMLGLIVERVTEQPIGKYLEEKIWQPLGMQHRATWSYDDQKHQSSKTFCCFNTTAIDLAKIARLYLNNGEWNGKQILSKEWVDAARTPNVENDSYQNQWYSSTRIHRGEDGEYMLYPDSLSAIAGARQADLNHFSVSPKRGSESWYIRYSGSDFYALGILGQIIYIAPEENLIMIRLGEKADSGYLKIFDAIQKTINNPKISQSS